MSVLDDKASRVLRTIFRTAMNPKKVIGSMLSEAHYDVCSRIGEEGVVLLRNQKGILPVEQGKYRRILVVGDNATRRMSYGGGSSELKTQIEVSQEVVGSGCEGERRLAAAEIFREAEACVVVPRQTRNCFFSNFSYIQVTQKHKKIGRAHV